MKPGSNGKGRPRGRSQVNKGSRGGPSRNHNHTFDSNGPGLRVRGNAHQVVEKYQAMARDAAVQGDRVLCENYLQHAEHYFRIILTQNANNPQRVIQRLDQSHALMDSPEDYAEGDDSDDGDVTYNGAQGYPTQSYPTQGYQSQGGDGDEGEERSSDRNGNRGDNRSDNRGDNRNDGGGQRNQRRDRGEGGQRDGGQRDGGHRDGGQRDIAARDAGGRESGGSDSGDEEGKPRRRRSRSTRAREAGDAERRSPEQAEAQQPAEAKAAEVKPAEPKPVEAKPVEAAPVEAKAVDAKPEPKVKPAKAAPAAEPAEGGVVDLGEEAPKKAPRRRRTTKAAGDEPAKEVANG